MIAAIFAREANTVCEAGVVREIGTTLIPALVTRLRAVAPRVRVEGPGLFVCDLAGLDGSPIAHGRRLVAASARTGCLASAGIAPTAFVARILALRALPPAVRVVDDGAAFLAPLPLATLPLGERLVDELRLLGLRRIHEFVALPRGAVLDRFGRAAAHVQALAAGEEPPLEGWDAPPRRILARRAFEHEIPDAERLVFLLRTLADEVAAALAADGLAALRLRLTLVREGRAETLGPEGATAVLGREGAAAALGRESAEPLVLERTILPPSRDAGALFRSLRWALEERPALGGVSGAALEVTAVEPARGRQIGLFAPDGARREEALAVARHLRARLGAGTVLRARVANAEARLPERAAAWDEVVT